MRNHSIEREDISARTAWVLCHRWFATGEGWAWPDSMPSSMREELLSHLRRRVQEFRGVRGYPHFQVCGGLLLVRTSTDPQCPDPLARPRHPVLITAVFIPKANARTILDEDTALMLDKAEAFCRSVVCADGASGLAVAVPERLTNSIRRRKTMLHGGLALGAILALLGCLFLAPDRNGFLGPEAGEKDIQAWATAAEKALRAWGFPAESANSVSVGGNTRSKAVGEFFRVLSGQESGTRPGGTHMDAEYLRRLPESAARVDKNPKESTVRDAMSSLLKTLTKAPSAKRDKAKPEAEIVDELIKAMDYRVWYTSDIRNAYFNGRDEPVPDSQRQYIYHFCPSVVAVEDGGLCKTLYTIMTKEWGVVGLCDEDVRKRPWFVAGCFFEFLSMRAARGSMGGTSQPAGKPIRPDEAALVQRLQKNLPKESLLSRDALKAENLELPIRDAIRALAKGLEVPLRGNDSGTILIEVKTRLKQIAESALEEISADEAHTPTAWYLERLACREPTQVPTDGASGR